MSQLRLDGVVTGAQSESRGIAVTLSPGEIEMVRVVATSTHHRLAERGLVSTKWDDEDPLEKDIQASGAEWAIAVVTKCMWLGPLPYAGLPDLWPNVEVRRTRHPNGGLIIRPSDKEGRLFFLVTGALPVFTVRGWIRTEEAKRDRYRWEDVWKVPQQDLRPPPAP